MMSAFKTLTEEDYLTQKGTLARRNPPAYASVSTLVEASNFGLP